MRIVSQAIIQASVLRDGGKDADEKKAALYAFFTSGKSASDDIDKLRAPSTAPMQNTRRSSWKIAAKCTRPRSKNSPTFSPPSTASLEARTTERPPFEHFHHGAEGHAWRLCFRLPSLPEL